MTAVKIKNGAVTAAKINTSGLTVPDALHATSAGSAAPSGTAGGALSGTYPNPGLAASAVTSSKIAAGAVQDAKIAAGTITADKLASGTLTLAHIAAWSTSGGTGETRSRRTAASCTTSVPSSGVQESDIVIGSVIGLPTPGGLITYGYICDNSGDLSGGWCNLTGSPITPTGGIGETFYGLR